MPGSMDIVTYFFPSFFLLISEQYLNFPNSGFHGEFFHLQEVGSFLRSYVVPEGFPGSVNESYVPYMTWRALKVSMIQRTQCIFIHSSS